MLLPLNIYWGIIFFVLLFKIKTKKWNKTLLVISFIWLFIISFSPIPVLLIKTLEIQNPKLQIEKLKNKNKLHILVLGSGHVNDTTLSHLNRLGNAALFRLTEGVRIYKKVINSKLILSGYSNSKTISQAKMLSFAAIEIGVNDKDTIQMIKPSNTEQEAIEFKNRFGLNTNLIIVTSASHMPRALKIFNLYGLNPVPAPTFNYYKHEINETYNFFAPSITKLDMSEKVIHEYLGIAYINIRELLK